MYREIPNAGSRRKAMRWSFKCFVAEETTVAQTIWGQLMGIKTLIHIILGLNEPEKKRKKRLWTLKNVMGKKFL